MFNIETAKKHYRILVLLVACATLSLTPLSIISFVALTTLSALFMPLRTGFLARIVYTFLVFVSVLSFIAGLGWVYGIGIGVPLIMILWSILIAVFILKSTRPIPKSFHIDIADIYSALVSIGVVIVLFIPVLPRPTAANLGPVIMSGGDNSAHLEMVKANDFNHGYALGLFNKANMGINLVSYPQGWHFSTAFMKWLVEDTIAINQSPLRIMMFFYTVSSLWFGLLSFLLVHSALSFMRSKRKAASIRDNIYALAPALSVCVVVAGWLFSLYSFGFQTQIAALTLLLAQVWLLAEAQAAEAPKRWGLITMATAITIGMTFMWLFLLPIAATILAVSIAHTVLLSRKAPSKKYLVLAPFLAYGVLLQPVIQLIFTLPGEKQQLNERGNVVHTSMYALICIMIVILLYAYYRFRDRRLRLYTGAALLSLAFSIVLFFYQKDRVGELRYYYFKSTYTFIIFAAVVLSAIAGDLWRSLVRTKSRLLPNIKLHLLTVTVFLLVVFGFLFSAWKSSFFDDYTQSRLAGIAPRQAVAAADFITQDSENGYRLLFIGSCNRGEDIRASQFARALAFKTSMDIESTAFGTIELSYLSKSYLFESIKTFSASRDVALLVMSSDRAIGQELRSYINNSTRSRVTVYDLDNTVESEPSTQCPDRVRTLNAQEISEGIL